MPSNKLSKRKANPSVPPICISKRPPPVLPPPPPPPWPPATIWINSLLKLNKPAGPETWVADGPANRVGITQNYQFSIDDGYHYWVGSLNLNFTTRHITGYAYGYDGDPFYYNAQWNGPTLPTPWATPDVLTTTSTWNLLYELSTIRPTA